jgi:hypothetical protein
LPSACLQNTKQAIFMGPEGNQLTIETGHVPAADAALVGEIESIFAQPEVVGQPLAPEDVLQLSATERDQASREKFATFLGGIAVGGQAAVESLKSDHPPMTLMEAARRAARSGDADGLNLVTASATTKFHEAIYKAGHISPPSVSKFTEDGGLMQHGQTHLEVYANTLRFANFSGAVTGMAKTEALNYFRITDMRASDELEDTWVFVASAVPDTITKEQADDDGFFTDSMSLSMQLTTAEGDECLTYSAFVAGAFGAEAPRHDIEALRRLYAGWGIKDAYSLGAAELLATPVAIPKALLPNGIVDIVAMYDREVAVVTGRESFFGQDKPPEDYLEYAEACKERHQRLQETIESAVSHMLQAAESFETPVDATGYLSALAKKFAPQQAVIDRTIDPAAFGPEAAYHVNRARQEIDMGNYHQAQEHLERAQETAIITGCPDPRDMDRARNAAAEKDKKNNVDDLLSGDEHPDLEQPEVTSGVCLITTENCYCCAYNIDGTARQEKLTVVAVIDEQGTAWCMRDGCRAWLSKDGLAKDEGFIARRAAEREKVTPEEQ